MSQNPDKFYKIKYMGFCMSQLPPNEEKITYSDFVLYAKFKLSIEKHRLMEDPIWDKYTDEQLLIEYYASLFDKNKEERDKFLNKTQKTLDTIDAFEAWANRQIVQNEKELMDKAKEFENSVNFTPETLGE